MDDSRTLPFLETERRNTDKSLSAEREKTTESLADVQQTEDVTDEVVNAERRLADRRKTSARSETDSARERKSDSLGPEGKARLDTEQLHDERRSADKVTEQERTRTDAAISTE